MDHEGAWDVIDVAIGHRPDHSLPGGHGLAGHEEELLGLDEQVGGWV
jgi:hypothetical protein